MRANRLFLSHSLVVKNPATGLSMYNLACFAARRGDRDKAIDGLRQALDHGYRDDKRIAQDVDLR